MIVFKAKGGQVTAAVQGVAGPACAAKLSAMLAKLKLAKDGVEVPTEEYYLETEHARQSDKVV